MVDDQTAYLQGLIDQTPNGTESNPAEVVLPAGTFRVDGSLSVSRKSWLVVNAGTGASKCVMVRTVPGGYSTRHITIGGCSHVSWLGGRVQGFWSAYDDGGVFGKYDPDFAAQHAMAIQPIGSTGGAFTDCGDILVEDFEVRDISGDFVYVAGTLYGPQGNRQKVEPTNVTIRRLLGEKGGRQGIGVVGVDGLVVEDCTIMAKRTGVDLENVLSGRIENVVIRRNAIRAGNGMVNGQSSNPICNHVLIEDNCAVGPGIRTKGPNPPRTDRRFDWKILRNIWPGDTYSRTVSSELFWFQYINDCELKDNYCRAALLAVHDRRTNGAVMLCGVDNITITGNDFRGENQVVNIRSVCTQPPTNVVENDNIGVWSGTIATHAAYPSQYDPNVEKQWVAADFPQMYPTPFATAGYWDRLPRGSGLGVQPVTAPTPLTVSTGRSNTFDNTTGTVDTATPFPITANHLYLAFVAASRNGGIAGNVAIPPSHGGLNWVLEKSLWIGAARRIHVFRVMSTVDLAAASISLSTVETGCAFWWTVLDWSGIYATGDSTDTIRQIGTGTTAGATFVEATFPVLPKLGNAVAGFCMHGVPEPQQIDVDHVLLAEGPVAEQGGQWASVDWYPGPDPTFRWDWASTIHALALTVEVQADTSVGGAAFPRVVSVTETLFKTNTTAHQVALPTADPGDLLLVAAAFDAAPTVTNPSGWTEKENVASVNHRRIITARVADGTEGTAVNLATTTAEAGAAQVYRIADWWGTLDGLAVGPVKTFGGVASNDVPSFAPEWGVEQTLWIAVLTVASPSAGINVSSPVGYSDGIETDPAVGSAGALVASACREVAAPSQNPGPFTMTVVPSGSASRLIAVRPLP